VDRDKIILYVGRNQTNKVLTIVICQCNIISMVSSDRYNIGKLIKQRRVIVPLTLNELSAITGVSPSHIGRIERGERFPSAHVLRRIAKPLGFQEEELFMLAGFLSDHANEQDSPAGSSYNQWKIDPFVANALAHEPVEIQRAMLGILSLLKTVAQADKQNQESRE
jgi:transcriptional regulator with XRE-family HTH domain